ncbi:MAG: cellulase family glycosylhydrolase [Spirochaetales bacterium]|nr:cellulase family glycosylhydrolase [Spirochaetales bacterium]
MNKFLFISGAILCALLFMSLTSTPDSIAIEDWESGNTLSGGTGDWAGDWIKTGGGDYLIFGNEIPYEGDNCIRFDYDVELSRTINMTLADIDTPYITFAYKGRKQNATGYVEVWDGEWHRLFSWTNADVVDFTWYTQSIDLSPFDWYRNDFKIKLGYDSSRRTFVYFDAIEIYNVPDPTPTPDPTETPLPTDTPVPTETPLPLNGVVIEAEDFTASYDTTPGNTRGEHMGKYREGDTDIEDCDDGNFNISWTAYGEWLEYIFNGTAGNYDVWLRASNNNTAPSTGNFLLNGNPVTSFSIPPTGDWQYWSFNNITAISINPGDTIRIEFTSNLGGESEFYPDYLFLSDPGNSIMPVKTPPPVPENYVSIVSQHGLLQVIGTQLCDASGNPLQLRGTNGHHIRWLWWAKDHTIQNLAYDFGTMIVRIPTYVEPDYEGCLKNQTYYDIMIQRTKDYVDDAIEAGLYVVIDWHVHTDPAPYVNEAIAFFDEMSQLYGGYPNVLWEICNEPSGATATWENIKLYANQVIPVIRAHDPDNIIIVGTPNWSQDVDAASTSPLTGYTNIMYALHFYAADHTDTYRNKLLTAINNNIPIFCTEWGTSGYDPITTPPDFYQSQLWLDILDANNISWINWSFIHKTEYSSILLPAIVGISGPWSNAELSDSGIWIKEKITLETIPPIGMDLNTLDFEGLPPAGLFYKVTASGKIKNEEGYAVVDAIIHYTWSGAVSGSGSVTTDFYGNFTVTSPKAKNGGTFTFTIDSITKNRYTDDDSLFPEPRTQNFMYP